MEQLSNSCLPSTELHFTENDTNRHQIEFTKNSLPNYLSDELKLKLLGLNKTCLPAIGTKKETRIDHNKMKQLDVTVMQAKFASSQPFVATSDPLILPTFISLSVEVTTQEMVHTCMFGLGRPIQGCQSDRHTVAISM